MSSAALWRNWFALSALLLGAAPAATAQQQSFFDLGDFRLESGQVIRECRLGYRTYGRLDAGRSNAVLFPTWFTGNTAALEPYIGPGRMLDPNRLFVITVDALGNGVSCSPSNSRLQPGEKFPVFTIRDMVESQYRLVTRGLGIQRLRGVIGISMGGMQTFQWMVSHPEAMEKAVPIIGTPRLTSIDMLLWRAEASALENARTPEAGVKTVSAIHSFALTTPEYRIRQTAPADFTRFLAETERATSAMFASSDWLGQLRAMLAHDVTAPFGGDLRAAVKAVRAATLIVAGLRDHMVNPRPALEFARLSGARTLELDVDCGHLVFECAGGRIDSAVSAFLQ